MTHRVFALAVTATVALSTTASGLPPLRESVVRVRVTVVAADGSTKDSEQDLRSSRFVGEYVSGGSLGINLCLFLKAGGKFECERWGCLGVDGRASGTWKLEKAGLKLVPLASDWIPKGLFGHLRVVVLRQYALLLPEWDVDWFQKAGADTRCLHPREASKALEVLGGEQFRRRIDAVLKLMEEQKQPPKK